MPPDAWEEEVKDRGGGAPDGGWGWVVVASSFFCNAFVDGTVYSFGVFLSEMSRSLGESKTKISMVGSLLSGFYLMAGPFAGAMSNRFGFRAVAIAGSVISCIAFAVSSCATTVEFLSVWYGIIGGVGFGLIYVPAVVTTGFYFDRWRALATGVAVCGSGIGTFLLAPFTTYLIHKFGWRGAVLIQGGLVLNCAIFGALFRPLRPSRATVKDEETEMKHLQANRVPLLEKASSLNGIEGEETVKQTDIDNFINGNVKHCHSLQSSRNNNAVVVKSTANEQSPPEHRFGSFIENSRARNNNTDKEGDADDDVDSNMQDDQLLRKQGLEDLVVCISNGKTGGHCNGSRNVSNNSNDGGNEKGVDNLTGVCLQVIGPDCQRVSKKRNKAKSSALDVTLLQSPTFLLLSASGFMTMMGFFVPFMFLADRAVLMGGMDMDSSVWLVSAIGMANTAGRVACGVVTSMPGVNALFINNVALTIGGLATILSGLQLTPAYQFSYATVFGLAVSCFASLRSILVVDLMGLDKLTDGFALLLLFQGMAATIGSPIAGYFMELVGSYDASFYLSGGLILTSAVMCYPLSWLNSWERRRQLQEPNRVI